MKRAFFNGSLDYVFISVTLLIYVSDCFDFDH